MPVPRRILAKNCVEGGRGEGDPDSEIIPPSKSKRGPLKIEDLIGKTKGKRRPLDPEKGGEKVLNPADNIR